MDHRKQHVGKMESNLKEMGKKIDSLVAKAGVAGAEVKADSQKRIQDLKVRHHEAHVKLEALKAAGSDKWDAFKVELDTAWSDFENAFKHLTK